MAAGIPLPDRMNVDVSTAAENWSIFRQQWEDYEIATELEAKEEKVRVATLRSAMGAPCLKILSNLPMSVAGRGKVQNILEELTGYFEPQRNPIYERSVFYKAKQKEFEPINQYVNRLRQLAATCEFKPVSNEENIRDRLVLGIRDKHVKQTLIGDPKLTLTKAIDICRAAERTGTHMEKLTQSEPLEIEDVNYYKSKFTSGNDRRTQKSRPHHKDNEVEIILKCYYCGESHRKKKEACPAFGKKCGKCKRMNHSEKVCRQRKVHAVETGDASSDSEEEAYTITHRVGSVRHRKKQLLTNLEITHDKVKANIICQLDSGATCNVISHNDFKKLALELGLSRHQIRKNNVSLKYYNGMTSQAKGEVDLTCLVKGVEHKLTFQVVEGQERPLIGLKSCLDMQLITVNAELVNLVQNS